MSKIHAIEEIIQAQASQGWAYLRADSFLIEEKGGLFSSTTTTQRSVLVFQRARFQEQPRAAQPVGQQIGQPMGQMLGRHPGPPPEYPPATPSSGFAAPNDPPLGAPARPTR
ncbi:MAG: hypothetical protein AAF360_15435 [Pseudomonadota bacterium]